MIKIGQIKIAQGSAKKTEQDVKAGATEAKTWFQKAIDEKTNMAAAYYQLSFAEELLANKDGAISAMEKAVTYENNNASYVFNLARLHQIRGNDEDNKIAEALYKKIIEANDKEINTHFSLGLLYEKMKKPNDATTEYKEVLTLLGAEDKETRTQIQKMIDNVARGIANTPESISSDAVTPPTTPPATEVPVETPPLIQTGQ
jgi:tetratricopeptide (TPR) repeat protein